jgi:hypothetical protein
VHHHGEELLMFPVLRDRGPGQEGAIDRVSAQHHDVDGGVAEATELLAAWPQDKGTEIQQRLGRSLQELGTTLATHLEEEEREMLPLCADHLSMEEWGALPAHAMANFTGNKHWLILGLVFEQMTAQQRQDILEHMPPPPREMWTSMGADAFASRTGTSSTDPGIDRGSAFVESFNGKLGDELLDGEISESLFEAKVPAEDFRIDYNRFRPHSPLGYLAPSQFAGQRAISQARPSAMMDS